MKLKRNHHHSQRYLAPQWPVLLYGCLSGCAAGSNLRGTSATVAQPPQITRQPADQTLFIGDTASFTVAATGAAPLAYEWRRNGASLNAVSAATYTTAGLTAIDDGTIYTVVVSNGSGSVVSSAARLSVSPQPAQVPTAPQGVSDYSGHDTLHWPVSGIALYEEPSQFGNP